MKRHLTEKFANDIDAYIYDNTDFILDILARGDSKETALAETRSRNIT